MHLTDVADCANLPTMHMVAGEPVKYNIQKNGAERANLSLIFLAGQYPLFVRLSSCEVVRLPFIQYLCTLTKLVLKTNILYQFGVHPCIIKIIVSTVSKIC